MFAVENVCVGFFYRRTKQEGQRVFQDDLAPVGDDSSHGRDGWKVREIRCTLKFLLC